MLLSERPYWPSGGPCLGYRAFSFGCRYFTNPFACFFSPGYIYRYISIYWAITNSFAEFFSPFCCCSWNHPQRSQPFAWNPLTGLTGSCLSRLVQRFFFFFVLGCSFHHKLLCRIFSRIFSSHFFTGFFAVCFVFFVAVQGSASRIPLLDFCVRVPVLWDSFGRFCFVKGTGT